MNRLLGKRIPHGRWSLWEMLRFGGDALHRSVEQLTRWSDHFDIIIDNKKINDAIITNDEGDSLKTLLSEVAWLRSGLKLLGCGITDKRAESLELDLSEGRCSWNKFREGCADINSRLRDELSLTNLFVVDQKYTKYFDKNAKPFGDEVSEKFASAAYDIDEAGKCLSLDRSTASAFHLMRVMEIGVHAVAKSLGIPDPVKPADRNWAIVLREIKKGIDERWPSSASKMSGDGVIFESLYASLDAVKNPWRNATMHVEKKYTEEEAGHLYEAVKGFMKVLASRMDEQGLPLA